jgi:integrase/recombinase XerD
MKKIKVQYGLIEGKERLKLYFDYDKEVIELVRTIPGARWNPKEKCWHVSTLAGPVEKLNRRFEGKLVFNEDKETGGTGDKETGGTGDKETGGTGDKETRGTGDKETRGTGDKGRINLVPDEFMKTLTLKNYSPNTIRTYRSMLQEFLVYYQKLDPIRITEEQIRDYLLYLIEERKVSISYQNQSINAIKFYYEKVLGRPVRTYFVQRPKKEKILPNVLSEQEVLLILNNTDNIKHKAILSLIYSAGLRRGELINMKINDIDSKRMYVIIRQGKGRKDRYSILSEKVLDLLRRYVKQYKPAEWLFEGQYGGQYGASSIQHILKDAVAVSKIRKRVTVHTLRHSFATHLLERGTDIRYIQELLGHQSSKTTEIYTHMTQRGLGKIKSPLDSFDI